MNKFGKYIVGPIIVAILAFAMQALDQVLSPVFAFGSMAGDWIAFQAWAIYFLAGCNINGGVKGFIAYIIGIVASIAIMSLGGALGGFWVNQSVDEYDYKIEYLKFEEGTRFPEILSKQPHVAYKVDDMTPYVEKAERVIFGPEVLSDTVRLAFVVMDDAIIELYEEK